MTFIPTPGAVRTAMQFTMDDNLIVNTMWGYKNAVISVTDLDNMNSAALAWWQANIQGQQCANVVLNSIVSYDQSAIDAPSRTLLVTTSNAGTKGGQSLPGNVAIVVSFRTNGRGRSSRGRMYLFGFKADDLSTPNQISAALRTTLVNAAVDLVGKIAFVGLQHVIVSHFFNKAPRTAGLVQPVTSQVIDTYVDSQRRRLTGRGV